METYRLAICEDDPQEGEQLQALCDEILTQRRIEHTLRRFSSADALARAIEQDSAAFDLLLLDIQMEGKSGMELARELYRNRAPVRFLFITGNPGYALEGYAVHPIHYLLKPVDRDALAEVLAQDWQAHRRTDALLLRYGGKTLRLPVAEIWYIESSNHTVTIRTRQTAYQVPLSLSEVERLAPAGVFCRSHNSYLINLGQVEEIGRMSLRLRDGTELPVGRRYYRGLQTAFVHYLNGNGAQA